MAEESTNPDLVELVRRNTEAANRREWDAVMRFYATDAVWDASHAGIGTFEGAAAIRSFLEDWVAAYTEHERRLEEIDDLGNGVTFAVALLHARLAGSDATAQQRWSYTFLWEAGVISRAIIRADIDEARAAAERVA